jgi:hypothetical protein
MAIVGGGCRVLRSERNMSAHFGCEMHLFADEFEQVLVQSFGMREW